MIWFRKKDPVCGMKEEKGKGEHQYGNWFCNKSCMEKYEKYMSKKRSCC